jgi:hypothetical protein
MSELFQTCTISSTPPAPANDCRYFILAYWGAGGRWKIHKTTHPLPDCDTILREIQQLRDNGWSYITVCQLPEIK